MQKLARTGDSKERARRADRASRQLRECTKKKIAADAYSRMDDFDKHLKAHFQSTRKEEENLEDLPIGAEAGATLNFVSTSGDKDNASDDSSVEEKSLAFTGSVTWTKSASEATLRSRMLLHSQTGIASIEEAEKNARRPPSPLAFYDYGVINHPKPKSAWAQRREHVGHQTRMPERAATSCGFYFPGPDFKQGPYGAHMLDPILMPPRCWEPSREAPDKYVDYIRTNEARPSNTADTIFQRRNNFAARPASAKCVRATRAHLMKSQHINANLEHERENANLEKLLHENGTCEGKWHDPRLDPKKTHAPWKHPPAIDHPTGDHSWIARAGNEAENLASSIIFGIQRALRENRSTLPRLFHAFTHGQNALAQGVLRVEDFMEGLVRLHVLDTVKVATKVLMDAMSVIDPMFDGYVYFPPLREALRAADAFKRHERDGSSSASATCSGRRADATAVYSDSLRMDVVKVCEGKTLNDFERMSAKFRNQQVELLEQHGELKN